jgi:hypothetical protein
VTCPNCDSRLAAPLLPDLPAVCSGCRATLVLRADGDLDVIPVDGDPFDLPPESLAEPAEG